MPSSSPTTPADLPLLSQFWTASRLKVMSNFRRSETDVCCMGLVVHCRPDSLSVNSGQPHLVFHLVELLLLRDNTPQPPWAAHASMPPRILMIRTPATAGKERSDTPNFHSICRSSPCNPDAN